MDWRSDVLLVRCVRVGVRASVREVDVTPCKQAIRHKRSQNP